MYVVPEVRKRNVKHEPRAHPWRHSGFEGGGSYHDFKAEPELIREVLEDFKPFEQQEAVETFYNFLAYLNGPDSLLESNDCALRAPHEHEDVPFNSVGLKLKIDGRVECVYRDVQYNVNFDSFAWLIRRYFYELCFLETDFRDGLVEIGMRPTYFPELLTVPIEQRYGERVYFQFRAYGRDEAQAWGNLNTIFRTLHKATENLHATLRAASTQHGGSGA
jgi:hypothetical protein